MKTESEYLAEYDEDCLWRAKRGIEPAEFGDWLEVSLDYERQHESSLDSDESSDSDIWVNEGDFFDPTPD